MLEGLHPNNAAHRLTLVTDERRARAVADLIVESFEPGLRPRLRAACERGMTEVISLSGTV